MSKYYKAEDVIRKRAEDLDDTSYWEFGNERNVDEWIEVAEMEFKDLPTIEVSEDCASKASVISALSLYRKTVEVSITPRVSAVASIVLDTVDDCIKLVGNAPSVVPSRAEGEWVVRANGNNECSICGREKQNGWINFCGFCGAKMKGVDDDSNSE